MTEKRFLLKFCGYEPYFIDTTEEYIDEDYFEVDGYPTMSDSQVVDLLNELIEENNQLKQRMMIYNEGDIK